MHISCFLVLLVVVTSTQNDASRSGLIHTSSNENSGTAEFIVVSNNHNRIRQGICYCNIRSVFNLFPPAGVLLSTFYRRFGSSWVEKIFTR